MLDISSTVDRTINQINHMIDQITTSSIKPKKHSFTAKRKNGQTYFSMYVKSDGKRGRKYLGKSNSISFVNEFKSAYNDMLLKILKADLKLLNEFKKKFRPFSPADVKSELSPCVQKLSTPSFFSEKMKELFSWANENYPRNTREFGKQKIYAKDGRRVRSKSECIIYNALLDAGIPFRYDSLFPLMDPLNDISQKAPDFLFKCFDGTYIIWEHAGMLGDAGYASDFSDRLRIYTVNGYELNVNLFITSDYVDGGINSEALQDLIDTIRQRVFQL